jgi:hypothetical protein
MTPAPSLAPLDPSGGEVVRAAAAVFLDGRLVPDFPGATVVETRNSRYRLAEGVVVAAADEALVGAEMIGWLCASARGFLVKGGWEPGARAVLVDRRGGNVVVTSAVRLLRVDEPGFLDESASGARRCRGATHTDFRSWHPPAPAPVEDEGELDEVTPPWPARPPPSPGREASSSGVRMPAPPRLPAGWDARGRP